MTKTPLPITYTKGEFARLWVYESILEHLEIASQDKRKRERIRSLTALRRIDKWYKEGEVEYERRHSEANSNPS